MGQMNRFKYESILFMESLVKALRAKQTNLESNKIFFFKRIEREREREMLSFGRIGMGSWVTNRVCF